jgi:hypothetical protein
VDVLVAAFVLIAFNSSNRQYYDYLESITPDNLHNTILNVMIYCLLKSLSLCIMCFLLSRKLGMSATHLVAYVLVYQWEAVFTRILTWVVYTPLTSLEHSGTTQLDRFCFEMVALTLFSWLRRSRFYLSI